MQLLHTSQLKWKTGILGTCTQHLMVQIDWAGNRLLSHYNDRKSALELISRGAILSLGTRWYGHHALTESQVGKCVSAGLFTIEGV